MPILLCHPGGHTCSRAHAAQRQHMLQCRQSAHVQIPNCFDSSMTHQRVSPLCLAVPRADCHVLGAQYSRMTRPQNAPSQPRCAIRRSRRNAPAGSSPERLPGSCWAPMAPLPHSGAAPLREWPCSCCCYMDAA